MSPTMGKREKLTANYKVGAFDLPPDQYCPHPSCFFCLMKEPDTSNKRAAINKYLKNMLLMDDEELILVISGIWNLAMTSPYDKALPSLGIFECMANLINKGINDKSWLLRNQNIYIPYYAAHIIGSYTMNNAEYAKKAVESGVIPPLLELLKGKMSWVEQRVAVRALGHLASYNKTFKAVEMYEEVIKLAMNLASTCLNVVYNEFIGVKGKKRLEYHCNLLTRGIGGVEMQNHKAEEWASQLQCWCIHLISCFAIKESSLDVICNHQVFLKGLPEMWGGLVNHTSPAGVGLLRILCYSNVGRSRIAESEKVIENLCNLTRSSDDWQYIAIDCLILLLEDPDTRNKVLDISIVYLVDLIELRTLGRRKNIGEAIMRALTNDFQGQTMNVKNLDAQIAMEEIWKMKAKKRREKHIPNEKLQEKRVLANLTRQQANHRFLLGDIHEAFLKYTEAIELCPLRYKNKRIELYSNRAQCNLILGKPDAAISDATRALSLTNPPNSHARNLWRRAQVYDMKGLARESLMDCLMFVNCCIIESKMSSCVKIPHYAIQMISKQMNSTWLFKPAQIAASKECGETSRRNQADQETNIILKHNKRTISGFDQSSRRIFG